MDLDDYIKTNFGVAKCPWVIGKMFGPTSVKNVFREVFDSKMREVEGEFHKTDCDWIHNALKEKNKASRFCKQISNVFPKRSFHDGPTEHDPPTFKSHRRLSFPTASRGSSTVVAIVNIIIFNIWLQKLDQTSTFNINVLYKRYLHAPTVVVHWLYRYLATSNMGPQPWTSMFRRWDALHECRLGSPKWLLEIPVRKTEETTNNGHRS